MSDRTERSHGVALHLFDAFGPDAFGKRAEAFARFFGTPRFLIAQTLIVVVWIALNGIALSARWDPYPFILLNLLFSLQAAYAAPLILLAQTRQADRERALASQDMDHREQLAREAAAAAEQRAEDLRTLIELNTRLTQEIQLLAGDIHAEVVEGR